MNGAPGTGGRVVGVATLCAAALLLACTSPAFGAAERGPSGLRPSPSSSISADAIVERVVAGQPIAFDGVTVVGDLDLRSVQTVTRPFRCTDCTFEGSLRASDVVFDRIVDLSGAVITGSTDLNGTVFRDAFLLRPTLQRASSLAGPVSFALARFEGRAAFDGVRFSDQADFDAAQFLADASFADAEFARDAQFGLAIFAGNAQFSGSPRDADSQSTSVDAPPGCAGGVQGVVRGTASFAGAAFGGKADFRQRCFAGDADFSGATFGAADFTLARFLGAATFNGVGIDGPASFRIASFAGPASFQNVVASGSTDFEAAVFERDVSLFGMSVAGPLSLSRIRVNGNLDLNHLRADALHMDLNTIPKVSGEPVQEEVLGSVATTARDEGDLAQANDATFALQSLRTDQSSGVGYLWGLGNRYIAGYLVRPLRPLVSFLILLAVGAVIRAWAGPTHLRPRLGSASGSRRAVATHVGKASFVGLGKVITALLAGLTSTLAVALRGKPGGELPSGDELTPYVSAAVHGIEYLAFKALTAFFLIGLANSNPTLKQLVEAVLR